jgi:drug/metabolite transporter (DMT)-like permease
LTVAAWVVVILIGGGNAVGGRVSNFELDPWWGAMIRFGAATFVFGVIFAIVRPTIGSSRALLGAALYGLVGFGLQFAFLYWALRDTPAGVAQVIIALAPLLTVLLAIAHRLEAFRWKAVLGALLALTGVAVIFAERLTGAVPLVALFAVVASAACLAESLVILKLTPATSPITTNLVGMGVGTVFLAGISLAAGERWVVPQEPDTWIALGYLVVGGSILAWGLYVFIVRRWSASATSYSLLLLPLATVVYAAVLLGEEISPTFVIGGTIVLVGVWIGVWPRILPGRGIGSSAPPRRTMGDRTP